MTAADSAKAVVCIYIAGTQDADGSLQLLSSSDIAKRAELACSLYAAGKLSRPAPQQLPPVYSGVHIWQAHSQISDKLFGMERGNSFEILF